MRRVLCLLLLVLAGCGQPLDVRKDLTLEIGEVHCVFIDAPSREQKVVVSVTSDVEVDAWIVKGQDEAAINKQMNLGQKPTDALSGKQKITSEKIDATIPARTAYTIVVGNSTKNAKVNVKITGK